MHLPYSWPLQRLCSRSLGPLQKLCIWRRPFQTLMSCPFPLQRLFKKVEQSQGDSPLDPERKGKPFGVGDPDFKLKAPLTGESTRKASKYSVGPTVQGDNPRLPAPLPRAARPGPSPAPVKIFSGEGGEGGLLAMLGGAWL